MKIATLLFPIQETSILLALKKDKVGKGLLNGWGGKLEPEDNGDVRAAACREFEQESGAIARPDDLELVAIVDFFIEDTHIFECHVFFCRRWLGELRETAEMGEPEPYPLSRMPFERMMAADVIWLRSVVQGERLRWTIQYNKDNTKVLSTHAKPL